MKNKKILLVISMMLIASFILSGCGGSGPVSSAPQKGIAGGITADSASSSMSFSSNKGGGMFNSGGSAADYGNRYEYETAPAEPMLPEEGPEMQMPDPSTTQQYDERKIVYYASVETQTKNMEEAIETVNSLVNKTNAYIEDQSVRNNGDIYSKYRSRYASLTVRVPSKNFDEFLDGLENDNIYVTGIDRSSVDYSESYYDKESRIKSLRTQEERLLELLANAQTVEVMLQIENNLANVRYEIESLTKEMRYIDSRVDYSTITLTISEVVRYTEPDDEPTNFIEELIEAIKDSGKDFVSWAKGFLFSFIYVAPYLAVVAVVGGVVVAIVKSRKRKKLNRQYEKSTAPITSTEEEKDNSEK